MKQTANPFADFGNAAVEAACQLTRISMESGELPPPPAPTR